MLNLILKQVYKTYLNVPNLLYIYIYNTQKHVKRTINKQTKSTGLNQKFMNRGVDFWKRCLKIFKSINSMTFLPASIRVLDRDW